MARDGLTRKQAEDTIRMQYPIESKREQADIIIDNSRDLEHTASQVRKVWKLLQEGE
jgi:dephospho-CoA kinase